ncbi:hypothetical protein [Vibrio phage phiKT1028]|nr:hypothetical protein [Vibrio phage phiKT1028]
MTISNTNKYRAIVAATTAVNATVAATVFESKTTAILHGAIGGLMMATAEVPEEGFEFGAKEMAGTAAALVIGGTVATAAAKGVSSLFSEEATSGDAATDQEINDMITEITSLEGFLS